MHLDGATLAGGKRDNKLVNGHEKDVEEVAELTRALDAGQVDVAVHWLQLLLFRKLRKSSRVGRLKTLQTAVAQMLKDQDEEDRLTLRPGSEESELEIAMFVTKATGESFDLAQQAPIRVYAFTSPDLGPTSPWILAVVLHHIVMDAASSQLFWNDFHKLYARFLHSEDFDTTAPELVQQLETEASNVWQRSQMRSGIMAPQLQYWMKQLTEGGVPPLLELPFDKRLPDVVFFRTSPAAQKAFSALCHAQGASMFMGLLAVFYIMVERLSGQQDFIIGAPSSGRESAEVQGIMGYFVNTLPLRLGANFTGEEDFKSLLASVRETVLDAYKHMSIPFHKKTPHNPALHFEGAQWTYQDLWIHSGRVTRALRMLDIPGYAAELHIGLLLDRGLENVAAMVGTLRSKGVFVPLDTEFPRERLRYMARDSGLQVIITQRKHYDIAIYLSASLTRGSEDDDDLSPHFTGDDEHSSRDVRLQRRDSRDPHHATAYIFYTSGSTGDPKGVVVPHAALMTTLWWTVHAQVKLHGMRIELQECQVSSTLVAFIMLADGTNDRSQGEEYLDELRTYLREHLPMHMVPTSIRITTNDGSTITVQLALDILRQVWMQALGVDQVDDDEDIDADQQEERLMTRSFFELGGDSLAAIRAIALAKARGMQLALDQFFRTSSLPEMARSAAASM
uniref:Carrier domain-containing protein n=1 Tax=Phytophthora ramorum TaxID=164328 RepID=H3HBC7_PHYRM